MRSSREIWEIYIPWTDPETWRQKNDWLKQWRRAWKDQIYRLRGPCGWVGQRGERVEAEALARLMNERIARESQGD